MPHFKHGCSWTGYWQQNLGRLLSMQNIRNTGTRRKLCKDMHMPDKKCCNAGHAISGNPQVENQKHQSNPDCLCRQSMPQ